MPPLVFLDAVYLIRKQLSPLTPPDTPSIARTAPLVRHTSFVSSKEESLFLQRKNPRKIAWTVVYRRVNKKGVTEEVRLLPPPDQFAPCLASTDEVGLVALA